MPKPIPGTTEVQPGIYVQNECTSIFRYRGARYRAATEDEETTTQHTWVRQPTWVRRLLKGVSPDIKATHRHLVTQLMETLRGLEVLQRQYANEVFDEPDLKQLNEIVWVLKRYMYPVAGVEVVEPDDILLLDELND